MGIRGVIHVVLVYAYGGSVESLVEGFPASFRRRLPLLSRTRGFEHACCGVFAGETTVGRTDDRDVTIADPSVSGSHAAIDVLELPGGGGKRLTIKVGVPAFSGSSNASDEGADGVTESTRIPLCWGGSCTGSP